MQGCKYLSVFQEYVSVCMSVSVWECLCIYMDVGESMCSESVCECVCVCVIVYMHGSTCMYEFVSVYM